MESLVMTGGFKIVVLSTFNLLQKFQCVTYYGGWI